MVTIANFQAKGFYLRSGAKFGVTCVLIKPVSWIEDMILRQTDPIFWILIITS